ncbi:hypothetical protein HYW21_03290 [Candidatus Woesearchaeota archaeon]|nr:hypothetical protein [Candidatus Woesearchaeota archaeon]
MHGFRKSSFLLAVTVLIVASSLFLLDSFLPFSAADETGCCSGLSVPGTCVEESTEGECTNNGGQFYPGSCDDVPDCERGCCCPPGEEYLWQEYRLSCEGEGGEFNTTIQSRRECENYCEGTYPSCDPTCGVTTETCWCGEELLDSGKFCCHAYGKAESYSNQPDCQADCQPSLPSCTYTACQGSQQDCLCGSNQTDGSNPWCCMADNAVFSNQADCSASPRCSGLSYCSYQPSGTCCPPGYACPGIAYAGPFVDCSGECCDQPCAAVEEIDCTNNLNDDPTMDAFVDCADPDCSQEDCTGSSSLGCNWQKNNGPSQVYCCGSEARDCDGNGYNETCGSCPVTCSDLNGDEVGCLATKACSWCPAGSCLDLGVCGACYGYPRAVEYTCKQECSAYDETACTTPENACFWCPNETVSSPCGDDCVACAGYPNLNPSLRECVPYIPEGCSPPPRPQIMLLSFVEENQQRQDQILVEWQTECSGEYNVYRCLPGMGECSDITNLEEYKALPNGKRNALPLTETPFTDSFTLAHTDHCYIVEVNVSGQTNWSEPLCINSGDQSCIDYPNQWCDRETNAVKDCWITDNTNTTFEECGEGEYCMGPYTSSYNEAKCIAKSPCEFCQDPLGVFADYGSSTVGDSEAALCLEVDYCYYDTSLTTADYFHNCSQVSSCYDYQSAFSCLQNKCIPSQACQWEPGENPPSLLYPAYLELGVGVCKPADTAQTDCEQCYDPVNNVYGACTNVSCILQGDYTSLDDTQCLPLDFNHNGIIQNLDPKELDLCKARVDVVCRDYQSNETCEGLYPNNKSVAVDTGLLGDNHLLQQSNDVVGIGLCRWYSTSETGRCFKDADGDTSDDNINNNYDHDFTPPVTQIIPDGMVDGAVARINFSVNAYDVIDGVVCQPDYPSSTETRCSGIQETKYFFNETEPSDYKNPLVARDFVLNNEIDEECGGSGLRRLFIASRDKSNNLEVVRTYQFFCDEEGPAIDVNFAVQPDPEEPYDSSNLTVTVNLNEPAHCVDTLTFGEKSWQNLSYDDDYATSFRVQYPQDSVTNPEQGLWDGEYLYSITCSDKLGNPTQLRPSPTVRIKADSRILNELPNQTLNYTDVNLSVMTITEDAECRAAAVAQPYEQVAFDDMNYLFTKAVTPVNTTHSYILDVTSLGGELNRQYHFDVKCKMTLSAKTVIADSVISFVVDQLTPVVLVTTDERAGETLFNFSKWYTNSGGDAATLYFRSRDLPALGDLELGFGVNATDYCGMNDEGGCSPGIWFNPDSYYTLFEYTQQVCYHAKENIAVDYQSGKEMGGLITETLCNVVLVDRRDPSVKLNTVTPSKQVGDYYVVGAEEEGVTIYGWILDDVYSRSLWPDLSEGDHVLDPLYGEVTAFSDFVLTTKLNITHVDPLTNVISMDINFRQNSSQYYIARVNTFSTPNVIQLFRYDGLTETLLATTEVLDVDFSILHSLRLVADDALLNFTFDNQSVFTTDLTYSYGTLSISLAEPEYGITLHDLSIRDLFKQLYSQTSYGVNITNSNQEVYSSASGSTDADSYFMTTLGLDMSDYHNIIYVGGNDSSGRYTVNTYQVYRDDYPPSFWNANITTDFSGRIDSDAPNRVELYYGNALNFTVNVTDSNWTKIVDRVNLSIYYDNRSGDFVSDLQMVYREGLWQHTILHNGSQYLDEANRTGNYTVVYQAFDAFNNSATYEQWFFVLPGSKFQQANITTEGTRVDNSESFGYHADVVEYGSPVNFSVELFNDLWIGDITNVSLYLDYHDMKPENYSAWMTSSDFRHWNAGIPFDKTIYFPLADNYTVLYTAYDNYGQNQTFAQWFIVNDTIAPNFTMTIFVDELFTKNTTLVGCQPEPRNYWVELVASEPIKEIIAFSYTALDETIPLAFLNTVDNTTFIYRMLVPLGPFYGYEGGALMTVVANDTRGHQGTGTLGFTLDCAAPPEPILEPSWFYRTPYYYDMYPDYLYRDGWLTYYTNKDVLFITGTATADAAKVMLNVKPETSILKTSTAINHSVTLLEKDATVFDAAQGEQLITLPYSYRYSAFNSTENFIQFANHNREAYGAYNLLYAITAVSCIEPYCLLNISPALEQELTGTTAAAHSRNVLPSWFGLSTPTFKGNAENLFWASSVDELNNTQEGVTIYTVFKDGNPLQLLAYSPSDGEKINGNPRNMSLYIEDSGSGLKEDAFMLTINGTSLNETLLWDDFTVTISEESLAYNYTFNYLLPSLQDGLYAVALIVEDRGGNMLATSWQFVVVANAPNQPILSVEGAYSSIGSYGELQYLNHSPSLMSLEFTDTENITLTAYELLPEKPLLEVTTADNHTFTLVPRTMLGEGDHILNISAQKQLSDGSLGPNGTWDYLIFLDSTAPDFTLQLSKPVIASGLNLTVGANLTQTEAYELEERNLTFTSESYIMDSIELGKYYEETFPVPEVESGIYPVVVTLTDRAGNSVTKESMLTVDNEPPEITITSVTSPGAIREITRGELYQIEADNFGVTVHGTYTGEDVVALFAEVDPYAADNLTITPEAGFFSLNITLIAEGENAITIFAEDEAGNKGEDNVIVLRLDLNGTEILQVPQPRFGVASQPIYGLQLITSQAATCRYHSGRGYEWDEKHSFDEPNTNVTLHTKLGFDLFRNIHEGAPYQQYLYVTCQDSYGKSTDDIPLPLSWDNTTPVILEWDLTNVNRNNVIVEKKGVYATNLTIQTDDLVRCKYSPTTTRYVEMFPFDSFIEPNDFPKKTLSQTSKHYFGPLEDNTFYSYFVVCENGIGLLTAPAQINFSVNSSASSDIEIIHPEDQGFVPTPDVFFEVETLRQSSCRICGTREPGNMDDCETPLASIDGYTHTGTILDVDEGTHTYYVGCNDSLMPFIYTSTTFTLDLTPPLFGSITTDNCSWSLISLTASWNFTEDLSPMTYRYAIGTTRQGTDVVSWTEVGSNTTVTATDLSLQEGQLYYWSVEATNGAGLKSYGYSDGVRIDQSCKPITVTLIEPVFGVANHSPPLYVEVHTGENAQCHYATSDILYAYMDPFVSEGQKHYVTNYDIQTGMIEGRKYPFVVKCNLTESKVVNERSPAWFNLSWDTNKPVIQNVSFSNTWGGVIVEYPLATNLTVVTDDDTRCKYGIDNADYNTMIPFDAFTTIQPINMQLFDERTLQDNKSYRFTVICENGARLVSDPATITLTVDTHAQADMTIYQPPILTSNISLVFRVSTNKRVSGCTYGNTTNPTTPMKGSGKEWYSDPVRFTEGRYTYYVQCQFETAGPLEETLTFAVDTSKSGKANITTSYKDNCAWSLSTIAASWMADDNLSGIAAYNYSLGVYPDKPGITNWTTTTGTGATITGLNLTNRFTYYWNVIAQNGVGMWSDVANLAIKVDTTCQPPEAVSCRDGIQNQNETDVDCGGENCEPCETGKNCDYGSDCLSDYCSASGKCIEKLCSNDEKDSNNSETDVDCGGENCEACVDGKSCKTSTDCRSNYCQNDICKKATCSDTVKNGFETDIDCGGYSCTSCLMGQGCFVDNDCLSGYCAALNKTCALATCSDYIKNQNETDVDCGGPNCGKCAEDQSCNQDADCASGNCRYGQCGMGTSLDSDGDGMPDDWERQYGLDPQTYDRDNDSDGDGMTNYEEYIYFADTQRPISPTIADTDGDSYSDGQEVLVDLTNPIDPNDFKQSSIWGLVWIILLVVLLLGGAGYLGYGYYQKHVQHPIKRPVLPQRRTLTSEQLRQQQVKKQEVVQERTEQRHQILEKFGPLGKLPEKLPLVWKRPSGKIKDQEKKETASTVQDYVTLDDLKAYVEKKKTITPGFKSVKGLAQGKDVFEELSKVTGLSKKQLKEQVGADIFQELSTISASGKDAGHELSEKKAGIKIDGRVGDKVNTGTTKEIKEGTKADIFEELRAMVGNKLEENILDQLAELAQLKTANTEDLFSVLKSVGVDKSKEERKNVFKEILSYFLKLDKITRKDVNDVLLKLSEKGILSKKDIADVMFDLHTTMGPYETTPQTTSAKTTQKDKP